RHHAFPIGQRENQIPFRAHGCPCCHGVLTKEAADIPCCGINDHGDWALARGKVPGHDALDGFVRTDVHEWLERRRCASLVTEDAAEVRPVQRDHPGTVVDLGNVG